MLALVPHISTHPFEAYFSISWGEIFFGKKLADLAK